MILLLYLLIAVVILVVVYNTKQVRIEEVITMAIGMFGVLWYSYKYQAVRPTLERFDEGDTIEESAPADSDPAPGDSDAVPPESAAASPPDSAVVPPDSDAVPSVSTASPPDSAVTSTDSAATTAAAPTAALGDADAEIDIENEDISDINENMTMYMSVFHKDSYSDGVWKDIYGNPGIGVARKAFVFSPTPAVDNPRLNGINLKNIRATGPLSENLGIAPNLSFTIAWYGSIISIPEDDSKEPKFYPMFTIFGNLTDDNIAVRMYFKKVVNKISLHLNYGNRNNERAVENEFAIEDNVFADKEPHLFTFVKSQNGGQIDKDYIRLYLDDKSDPIKIWEITDIQRNMNDITTFANRAMELNPSMQLVARIFTFAIYNTDLPQPKIKNIYDHIINERVKSNTMWQRMKNLAKQNEMAINQLQGCPFGAEHDLCTTSCTNISNWNDMTTFFDVARDSCITGVRNYCNTENSAKNKPICTFMNSENAAKAYRITNTDDANLLAQCKEQIRSNQLIIGDPSVDNIMLDKSFRNTGLESSELLRSIMLNKNMPLEDRVKYIESTLTTDASGVDYVVPGVVQTAKSERIKTVSDGTVDMASMGLPTTATATASASATAPVLAATNRPNALADAKLAAQSADPITYEKMLEEYRKNAIDGRSYGEGSDWVQRSQNVFTNVASSVGSFLGSVFG